MRIHSVDMKKVDGLWGSVFHSRNLFHIVTHSTDECPYIYVCVCVWCIVLEAFSFVVYSVYNVIFYVVRVSAYNPY